MNNEQHVLNALGQIWPEWAPNARLVTMTGIGSHQCVFHVTRRLAKRGLIEAESRGGTWFFRYCSAAYESAASRVNTVLTSAEPESSISRAAFEAKARKAMEERFSCSLNRGTVPGVPKCFDFVSEDGQIIGDAKFYDMVRGIGLPPAKFSVIAEHVWLLESTGARHLFLIFGNNREVPARWIGKYGHLVKRVEFIYLDPSGRLETLNTATPSTPTVRSE